VADPVIAPRRAHAAAPVRLDFAGGWTDVAPFSEREGGAVVAAAISLQTHVNVLPGGDSVQLIAEDLGARLELLPDGSRLGATGLPLLEAGVRVLPVGACTIVTRADAPRGSGLGTSGALGVAIVAALSHSRGETCGPLELAEQAWRLEAVEAGHPGGRQDQYMAALGGFQALTFGDPVVHASPVAVDAAFAKALAAGLVLCYSGVSRVSGETIARVMQAYERGDAKVTHALFGLRDCAQHMREAIAAADLHGVAVAMDENWRHQQALDPAMRTAEMGRLEVAARAAGAVGAKAAGAGAGGSMFFLAPGRGSQVASAARGAGATVLPFSWSWEGVQRW
jgi:D-glycero-alpha-D-manno-heptose-7-phosphate kinase